MTVPFNRPYYNERENENIRLALSGKDFTEAANRKLSQVLGEGDVILTGSGSAALDLFFLSGRFKRGSEVIMPSFNYPSAANSVLRAGLTPVFAEIDPLTLTMDLDDACGKCTQDTCCMIPVHYGGASCDMVALMRFAASKGIAVLEDAALSIGAAYQGKSLGTLGDASIMSFHPTKNLSGEGGGAFVINNNAALTGKARNITENGTDRQDFQHGRVLAYTWREQGLNGSMPNINAAVLCAQLDKFEEISSLRNAAFLHYTERLLPLSQKYGFRLPGIPCYNQNNSHVFYIMLPSGDARERVRLALSSRGVSAYIHYMPLHASDMGRKLGYKPNDLPTTKSAGECILRLPLFAGLLPEQIDLIVDSLERILCTV